MTDRQTKTGASALDPVPWAESELWHFSEHVYRRERSLKDAERAIAASDAKYIPALVEALRLFISEAQRNDISSIDIVNDFLPVASNALAALPKEYRN